MKRARSRSRPQPQPQPRLHNKSKKSTLSVLDYTGTRIRAWYRDIRKRCRPVTGLIEHSPCYKFGRARDGRYTVKGTKVASAYQIVAYCVFGRRALKKVATSKRRNDITISHLCGTRYCCNPQHIILETKALNDERTHCHFVLNSAFEAYGFNDYRGVRRILKYGGCPHHPRCANERPEEVY